MSLKEKLKVAKRRYGDLKKASAPVIKEGKKYGNKFFDYAQNVRDTTEKETSKSRVEPMLMQPLNFGNPAEAYDKAHPRKKKEKDEDNPIFW